MMWKINYFLISVASNFIFQDKVFPQTLKFYFLDCTNLLVLTKVIDFAQSKSI